MSRPLRIPNPQTPLHLYRHLLREASYLPPPARPFIDATIKRRFAQDRDDDGPERSKKHMRQAQHDLRMLRAANAGDMVRMRRVMLEAFGRMGRRRRELVALMLHPDSPANTEELEKFAADFAARRSEKRPLDWLDKWDVEKLATFARSQVQAGLSNSPKAPISGHQTDPDKVIPSEDSWGRPVARRLYRTRLKKMWKSIADKCMPPLPEEEWEMLEAIALGREREGCLPPPRRPLARLVSKDAHEGRSWDWQSYATKPVAAVDRPARRRSKLLTGAVDDNTPTGDPEPVGCHNYTARSWRRMFADVWRLSAKMGKKPDGRGWEVVWGRTDFQPAPAATSPGAMEFFRDFPVVEEVPKRGGKRRGR